MPNLIQCLWKLRQAAPLDLDPASRKAMGPLATVKGWENCRPAGRGLLPFRTERPVR